MRCRRKCSEHQQSSVLVFVRHKSYDFSNILQSNARLSSLLLLHRMSDYRISRVDLGENVGLSEEVIFLLILELDLGAAKFGQENLIANFHAHRDGFAVLKRSKCHY